jgi:hypothetical protein
MASLDELRRAASDQRAELRQGDDLPPCRTCGHELPNHSPHGCCRPGCECKWPKQSHEEYLVARSLKALAERVELNWCPYCERAEDHAERCLIVELETYLGRRARRV